MISTPCSIRNRRIAKTLSSFVRAGVLAAAFAPLAGGCQDVPLEYSGEVNTTPLLVDQAMQKRSWETTVAYYPSGAIVADNIGFYLQPREDMRKWVYVTHATGVFLTDTIFLPYWMITKPHTQIYRGVVVEATYTAQPPLP